MSDEETEPRVTSPARRRRKQMSTQHASSPRQQQQQQQQQSQRPSSTPTPPPSRQQQQQRRQRPREGVLFRMTKSKSEEKHTIELVQRLEYGIEILLEKLFAYLSQLPEEEDDTENENVDPLHSRHSSNNNQQQQQQQQQRGMTLPASAIAWLSSQLYPSLGIEEGKGKQKESKRRTTMPTIKSTGNANDNDIGHGDCNISLVSTIISQSPTNHHNMGLWLTGLSSTTTLRDRLSLLRFLLPRVKLLRITRQTWPPIEIPSERKKEMQQQQQRNNSDRSGSRQRNIPPPAPPPTVDLNCTNISVDSAITMDELLATEDNEKFTSSTASSLRYQFLQYMNELINTPQIDLRIFPNLEVLIIEQISPSWIYNLDTLQRTLQVLRVNHAAVYDLPTLFFTKQQIQELQPPRKKKNGKEKKRQKRNDERAVESTTNDKEDRENNAISLDMKPQATPTRSSIQQELTQSFYSKLTYLKLDYCNIGELSNLQFCLSHLHSVEYLSLQHNQIKNETTALRGLQQLMKLRYLDLRYNLLTNMKKANLYLGGQLKTLKLSHNLLTTTSGGLNHCYAIQELWLDGNQFNDISNVSGLARLPELQVLRLHNNPVSTVGSSNYDPNWKLQLWTWFQEQRRSNTPLELPILVDYIHSKNGNNDGRHRLVIGTGVPTEGEWIQILEGSFTNRVVSTNELSTVVTKQANQQLPNLDSQNASMSSSALQQAPMRLEFPESVEPSSNFLLNLESVRSPTGSSTNRNHIRRVVKKAKTRRAKIQNTSNAISDIQNMPSKRHRKRRKGDKNGMNKSTKTSAATSVPVDAANSDKKMSPEKSLSSRNSNTKSTIFDRVNVSFSVEDVLVFLEESSQLSSASKDDSNNDANDEMEQEELSLSKGELENKEDPPANASISTNPFDDDSMQEESLPLETATEDAVENKEEHDIPDDSHDSEMEEQLNLQEDRSFRNDADTANEEKKKDEDVVVYDQPGYISIKKEKQEVEQKHVYKKRSDDNDRIFPSPKKKVATIKLHKGTTARTLFDVMDSDWEELVKCASEGRIPNGLPRIPLDDTGHSLGSAFTEEMGNGIALDKVFSEIPKSGDSNAKEQATDNQSTAPASATEQVDTSSHHLPNALPEHVWQDDNSVLSSLGAASRDDIPAMGTSKFQIAEENCFYDGPDTCRELKVIENLNLYFEMFVFPTSLPDLPRSVLEEMEEDPNDWQPVFLYFPRIQLWPEDRRSLEQSLASAASSATELAGSRERFVRLWEEDLVPCGKPSLRRLPPNRQIRLGFHGDKMYEGVELDAYAECRKVFLCLSSKALYIILRDDTVTTNHEKRAKKRRFPLPIDNDLYFRDAPWPHSVARHSLLDLETICIGFEFQRLTLRFQNSSLPNSDPFVYVLLTSNKKASVSILQDLQKLAKDMIDGTTSLVSDRSTIAIENDSNYVFDALNAAVAPDPVGTVIHYQIVQQYWQHGDRGTVRRVCVVTDARILLLDEDYTADAHNLSTITVKNDKMAEVQYRKVDEATLKQISEVQAAGTDPKAITIVIKPLSTLSRTHRWRLLCRDREGAERLVDDVRKAMEIEEGVD